MRHLILMRHGKAEAASSAGDRGRRLSGRGRAEAAEAGRRLGAAGAPSLALVSDSARTRETFEALALDPAPRLSLVPALYGATADAILAEVRACPDDAGAVLVVGHNPGIGDLARRLAGTGEKADLRALAEGFPTACFAALALDGDAWAEVGAPGRLSFLLPRGERSGA